MGRRMARSKLLNSEVKIREWKMTVLPVHPHGVPPCPAPRSSGPAAVVGGAREAGPAPRGRATQPVLGSMPDGPAVAWGGRRFQRQQIAVLAGP